MNKNQWWDMLNKNWDDLIKIVNRFCPSYSAEYLNALKDNKDVAIASILQDAWYNGPDHISVHFIQGWNALCDLCSENDCLFYE